jgi:ABC-2 type transport system permease protein
MTIPKLSLRRALLIARRDFLGYIKTWGFWISFFLPVIFGFIGFAFATSDISIAPKRYVTVIDTTGQQTEGGAHTERLTTLLEEQIGEQRERMLAGMSAFLTEKAQKDEFEALLRDEGYDPALDYLQTKAPTLTKDLEEPERPFYFVDSPAPTLEALKPYLRGEKTVAFEGDNVSLSGVMILKPGGAVHKPVAEYWTTNFNQAAPKRLLQRYMRRLSVEHYFADSGLNRLDYNVALDNAVQVEFFDPTKNVGVTSDDSGAQEVTMTDRVPYLAAAGLAIILWLTIFSGSYMLLTSMIEEKLNKLLEMMLASTRFSEIILGKLLGVAALTITAMSPYIILGAIGVIGYILFGPDQDVVAGLIDSFDAKTITFLLIYLVLGYILYGAFFIAMGSLASSMQDAQTLSTPIMLVMTVCLMVVPLGVSSPDSPILKIATYIPFSAPFAAIIRLPSEPPLWELLLSTAFLAILCVGVIAMANRIFRYGVLSGAGVEAVSAWFKRTVLRRQG